VKAERKIADRDADDDRHEPHGVVERFHRQPPEIIPWDNTPLPGDACKELSLNSGSHDYNCQILLGPLKAGERR
jgi:hypothetical protein